MIDGDLTTRPLAELKSTAELMAREWAPCRNGCPVHADVRAYLQCIAEGDWRSAIDVIREQLPFAAVCGRVCHHPCEDNCRRGDVDAKVAIRELKRFVAETQGAAGCTVNKAKKQDKARVAVVGAGPAGLSAALELAKLGYQPTVFEKADVAGGIPATTIPRYRLPLDVVQIDVDWICAHGVQIVTGVQIGKDKTVAQLREDGFAAVVVATGLASSRGLPIPNADHEDVHLVLDFLQAVSAGKAPKVGQNVLVIGGGNVAMDAARSAVRLGAKTVRAMCLENEEEMPAWDWEQAEARDEGVEFIHRRGPVEIVVEGGKIVGMKARKVTRVFDVSGKEKKFAPEYDDADVIDVACDTVVFAIGQMADLGFVEGSELTADRGRLSYNAATHETSVAGVFACGEIVTPPGSVVEACASGRRCAVAVDQFLAGQPIRIDDSTPPVIDTIPEATAEKVLKVDRVTVPADAAETRKTHFKPFEKTLDEAAVLREARRCMGCGGGAEVIVDKCAACLTCLRVCPFDIPAVTDVARIDSDKCQSCGICIAECPANAIVPRSRAVDELVQRTAAALNDKQKIVAYIGGFCCTADEWQGRSESIPGVAELYLASTSRLGVPELLHALENGAHGVVVVSCPDGTDRYPTTATRTKKRVEQARDLLSEIGLSPEKVQLAEVADQGRDAVREAIRQAVVKMTEE
jgi:formate dehydrogenase beta subunit